MNFAVVLAVLAAQDSDKLHKLIKPGPGEWRWAQVPWVATLGEAREKAAKEGKPLFVWTMAGEPLGQC